MPSKSELFSQVFLKDKVLVEGLVARSSIRMEDIVLEVGPGRGIITGQLLERAGRVVAVEKDHALFSELRRVYGDRSNFEIYNADILSFKVPYKEYKVFSNIPFAIEGSLVRKFIDSPEPPKDAYLVMRREVAERMAGDPKESQFSISHKPWFNLEIFYRFRRNDFTPKPKVESVMLRFQKRDRPLVQVHNRSQFELFVRQGFGGGREIKKSLASIFTPTQTVRLAQDLGFKTTDSPTSIALESWVGMFEFYLTGIVENQRRRFIGKAR